MGCHTWFYKKVDRTIEEAREKVIKQFNDDIEFWENALIQDDYEVPYGFTREDVRNLIKVRHRQIRIIEKGLCDKAVYKRQPELSRFYLGNLYIEAEGYHDLFRIGGYPEDVLTSYEQCVKFIEGAGCSTYELTYKRLKEFWNEHPDGIIEFG